MPEPVASSEAIEAAFQTRELGHEPAYVESGAASEAQPYDGLVASPPNAADSAVGQFVPATLEDAILCTVVYSDLFDYPLTLAEIHRYLIGFAASSMLVEQCLNANRRLREFLTSIPPFWFLVGREDLVRLRRQREAFSQTLRPRVHRYGRLLAGLPYVRMVALTGSLAMNNATRVDDDIDYLLITSRDRVWLARGLAISLVRWARQWGAHLCPNYVMSEHYLSMGTPSLFTAHELMQMVPLSGPQIYRHLLASNSWVANILPNAVPLNSSPCQPNRLMCGGQGMLEVLLRGGLGDALEHREQEQKIPRLRQQAAQRGGSGALFTPDLCKGHMDDHAAMVDQLYQARLKGMAT